ncbi:MAG: hypothetical protein IJX34_02270 [Clostridia bacterium]|nr:hypothetical protein [Clostridia bacterium]
MYKIVLKKLANGENTISIKISKFNLKLEEVKELKGKVEISSEIEVLDKKYVSSYYTKIHDLRALLQEIEEDNEIYFLGTLSHIVESLKRKIDLI